MSSNFERFFDGVGSVREGVLEANLWLQYLTRTDNVYVNAERLESMGTWVNTAIFLTRTEMKLSTRNPAVSSSLKNNIVI